MKRNKYPLHRSLTENYFFDLRIAKKLQGKRKPHRFSIGEGRKLRPYGKNLCPWIDEDMGAQSFCTGSNFRNRKVIRRFQRKALRAQYKRELISAIEDHISESMYDPYELDYDIISADMVYDRIMNREVEENLFEDSEYSLYDYDSDFDYFLDA